MPDRPSHPLTGLFGGVLVLAAMIAEARAETWYRVEMLIFSNSGGSSAEEWDATPTLSYPRKTRLLVDPGHPAARAALQEQNPLMPSTAPSGYNPVYPAPFVTLPPSRLEFRGAASRMQGSGRYRKLFHEAWEQPIPGRAQAIPIVLDRSGDGGPWPALQGTVKLYISRYIYMETNLWLNTNGEYLHSDWQMPPPPLAPPSVAPVDPYARAGFSSLSEEPAPPSDQPTSLSGQPVPPPAQPAAMERMESDNAYPYRHAVLLSQTRRMRSNEVNYIDHPMLGIVVKVSRVTVAEPADEPG
jgi:hypothetical protein